MREVSRSRKMRSPDFSVGLGDWELTMVTVGREGGWSWGGSGLEPEQGYKRSVSGSKGGPVRVVCHRPPNYDSPLWLNRDSRRSGT